MSSLPQRVVALLAAAMAMASAAAVSNELVRVELNKLEERDSGCRLYFLLDNATPRSFEAFKLDLVMFGPDGVIARRLAVDVAPLRAQKKTVKLFDVSDLACGGIGSVLLNDVLSCRAGQDERADCIDAVATASRGGVSLSK